MATVTLSITSPNITVSGVGYETATYTISSTTTTYTLLVARSLGSGELKVAALWTDGSTYDLDLNLFGPGNTTLYDATTAGVVNWEYLDKTAGLPFGRWTDRSNGFGCETIEISQLSGPDNYEFMLFDWSLVGGADPTAQFKNIQAFVYVWGGSSTGIPNSVFAAIPPTPPTGFVYGFWQPFIVQSTGANTSHLLRVVNSFDPAISQSAIAAASPLFYSCSYSYCPYSIPGL